MAAGAVRHPRAGRALAIARGLPKEPLRNPGAWRAGFIYFDKDDPALFVPKRYGVGYTLNVARPAAIVLIAATLVPPLVMALLTVR